MSFAAFGSTAVCACIDAAGNMTILPPYAHQRYLTSTLKRIARQQGCAWCGVEVAVDVEDRWRWSWKGVLLLLGDAIVREHTQWRCIQYPSAGAQYTHVLQHVEL